VYESLDMVTNLRKCSLLVALFLLYVTGLPEARGCHRELRFHYWGEV
jgi:hypothetical protein